MALDFGKIGAVVLGAQTGGISNAAGVDDLTPKSDKESGFLQNLFGSNNTQIPEAKTVQAPNNTGLYLSIVLVVIVLGVFIFYISKK